MKEKNQQLENMETEREMAQMLVGETRNILNDQAEELQASQAHILDLEKQVELTNEQDNLKDELMKTLDALKEKEDQVRSLKDELQNTNEIVEIQAQVLKEKDGNIKSDEFDTNKQRLEDAQDKIDYQAKQIKEQQKKIQTLMAGPSGSRSSLMLSPGVDGDSRRSIMSPSRKSSILLSPHEDGRVTKLEKHVEKWKARALGDAPNDLVGQWDRIEELEQQLENAKSDSRVQNLETQIEESDLHLEEALKEIENQAAEIKDKDVLIRSLEKAEDELEAKVFRIRDEFESTTMSLDDDLDVRDDIIEGLKTELEEAYQNIERLEENQKRGFATDSTQYKERDSFITSLELQLEDSDNTIQKMEHRIASKDHEISSLGSKLEKAQESLAELRSELEQIQERAMSKEEYSALQTALLHAKKSMKKGQKQIKKLSEEVEERKNAAQQLQEMYDEQEQRNIDMLQLQRKYEASQQTIKYLEKGKKEVVDYDEPDHKNEVHALRQKEADDANTMEERNREIVALRDELETIKQKTTKLVKNSEEMEKVVQLKEDEKDRLDATVCELKKELEVSNSLITSLRVEMKALESSVHSKSSKRLKKEKSMNELKIQIKQLSMELQTTKAERDKALIGNDTEIEELRNELRSSVQYSEGNDKRLAGLKKVRNSNLCV
jgi:chromosome segregation ATPase